MMISFRTFSSLGSRCSTKNQRDFNAYTHFSFGTMPVVFTLQFGSPFRTRNEAIYICSRFNALFPASWTKLCGKLFFPPKSSSVLELSSPSYRSVFLFFFFFVIRNIDEINFPIYVIYVNDRRCSAWSQPRENSGILAAKDQINNPLDISKLQQSVEEEYRYSLNSDYAFIVVIIERHDTLINRHGLDTCISRIHVSRNDTSTIGENLIKRFDASNRISKMFDLRLKNDFIVFFLS